MLKQLNVRNYVLIDSLEVAFPEGLVIITGQTGAGKSILLGALSLLLGAKADASAVGEEGDNCVVEALFVLGPDDPARKVLEENDLDWNGGELLIRRVVARSGRSRAFVNGDPASSQCPGSETGGHTLPTSDPSSVRPSVPAFSAGPLCRQLRSSGSMFGCLEQTECPSPQS